MLTAKNKSMLNKYSNERKRNNQIFFKGLVRKTRANDFNTRSEYIEFRKEDG